MWKRLWARVSLRRRRARKRRLLAESLLVSVEQLGILAFSPATIASLGLPPKLAFRLACALLWKERLHLLWPADGEITLMSNAAYERSLRRQADAAAVRPIPPSTADTDGDPRPAPVLDTVCIVEDDGTPAFTPEVETEEAILFHNPSAVVRGDMAWFTGEDDETDCRPAAARTAGDRQSLPSRRREPWPAGERLARDDEKE
ncbi:MAG: hypothetical protein LIP77_06900 [Planctomycetes bacterium]|nr:hypothetical protein [Planctomycetota bacterium]